MSRGYPSVAVSSRRSVLRLFVPFHRIYPQAGLEYQAECRILSWWCVTRCSASQWRDAANPRLVRERSLVQS
jgi:hypothetical protein